MGKCRFNLTWQQDPKYEWVRPVLGNEHEALCSFCRRTFKLGTMGLMALESHMKSSKHLKFSKARQQQAPMMMQFCTASTAPQPSTPANAATSDAALLSSVQSTMRGHCGSTPTLRAEVIWVLKTISDHHSYMSNEGISNVFTAMFPDSQVAAHFACGKNKTAYITKFGLAPFIIKQLVNQVNDATCFVIMFDESLNKTTKNKQLDLHLRYWVGDKVQSRYLGSQFMGHSKAVDLLKHFKECVRDLDSRKMVSVSMDGPNVNWRFFEMLQQEYAEQFGGAQLVVVGSCGLHTLHNALKCAFVDWDVEKVLRALHTIFTNVPARREDYCKLTKSDIFALPFCGHRWVENVPVMERALLIWPDIQKYVEAVRTKKLPHPGTSSYDTIEAATKDPLIPAKFHFFMAISRSMTPFLTKYQTDEPVLPFFGKDLAELLMSLLKRFIKRDLLNDVTPLQMVRLDVTDKQSRVNPRSVDIGIGAEAAIQDLQRQSRPSVGELSVLQFRQECMEGLSRMVQKIQTRSPLSYPTVRQMTCLNPAMMYSDPDLCEAKMKGLVKRFLQDKQLPGVAAGDVILQQFSQFLSVEVRSEEFLSFKPMEKRLDEFLHHYVPKPYPELWAFIQKLLVLSHGQATVERGFSVNKEVEISNIQEDTIIAHRIVCDYVSLHEGVTNVPLTPELLASVSAARARYHNHLESERRRKESEGKTQKRKAAEDHLEQLKRSRQAIQEVSEHLARDADKLADEAEGKHGSKMAELIAKSNAFRRSHKEKLAALKSLDEQIVAKGEELRRM